LYTIFNIEHHNEVFIFTNTLVLPSKEIKTANFDIVADKPGIIKTKNPIIQLNTVGDANYIENENEKNKNSHEDWHSSIDTVRLNSMNLSRPTPKFITSGGNSIAKNRFVFYNDPDGMTPQVIQNSPRGYGVINSRNFPNKRASNTPSVTDHIYENPVAAHIEL